MMLARHFNAGVVPVNQTFGPLATTEDQPTLADADCEGCLTCQFPALKVALKSRDAPRRGQ